MLSNIWMISAVVTPAGQIHQVVDQDINFGINDMFEGGSGTVDAEFACIDEQKPVLSFTTTALKAAIDISGISGYAVASATDVYFQRVSQGGVRDNSSAIKVTMSKGLLMPRTIDASHGAKKPATIKYELHAISTNGTTAPLTISTGQTLPTINPVSQLWTIGTCGLNAGSLSALSKMQIDFGIKEQVLGADGEAYPTFAGIATRRCKIGLDGFDMTALSTHGISGLALTSWKCYLRRLAPGSTRVADGTAQHIKLFGTTGMFRPNTTKGTDENQVDGNWVICPTYDGTNAVIQVSTASAIT